MLPSSSRSHIAVGIVVIVFLVVTVAAAVSVGLLLPPLQRRVLVEGRPTSVVLDIVELRASRSNGTSHCRSRWLQLLVPLLPPIPVLLLLLLPWGRGRHRLALLGTQRKLLLPIAATAARRGHRAARCEDTQAAAAKKAVPVDVKAADQRRWDGRRRRREQRRLVRRRGRSVEGGSSIYEATVVVVGGGVVVVVVVILFVVVIEAIEPIAALVEGLAQVHGRVLPMPRPRFLASYHEPFCVLLLDFPGPFPVAASAAAILLC